MAGKSFHVNVIHLLWRERVGSTYGAIKRRNLLHVSNKDAWVPYHKQDKRDQTMYHKSNSRAFASSFDYCFSLIRSAKTKYVAKC